MILACPNCESKFRVPDGAVGPNGRKVKCRKCGHQWHANQEDDLDGAGNGAGDAGLAGHSGNAAGSSDAGSMDDIARDLIARMGEGGDDAPPPPAAPEADGDMPQPEPPPEDADFGPRADDMGGRGAAGDKPSDFPSLGSDGDFTIEERTPAKVSRAPLTAWIILLFILLGAGGYLYLERNAVVHAYPPAEKLYRMVGLAPDLVGYGLELPQPQSGRLEGEPTTLFLEGTVRNTLDKPIDIPMLQGALLGSDGTALHTWMFKAEKDRALPTEEVRYRTEVVSPPRGAVEATVTFATPEEAMMMPEETMADDAMTGDAMPEETMSQDAEGGQN